MSSEIMTEREMQALVAALARIVGQASVLDRTAGRQQITGDMSWLSISAAAAGHQLSRQDAVATVSTTEQVAKILELANELGVPVTPFGGGSGVQGAANADRGGILLNLRGLNEIRRIDEHSLTCVVECGCIVAELEAALNERGLTFTHYPASAEWATVGGSLAARGSGVLSTRYGNIQDHVLSIELVLPNGRVIDTPRVPKHGVGPELTQLLIGSEGTLGVITAVTVKLRKLPAARLFSTFTFPTVSAGIEAGRRIMTQNLRPSVMRLYDKHAATHSLERAVQMGLSDVTMVMMFEGDFESVARAECDEANMICKGLDGSDLGSRPGESWWEKRYVFYHPPFAPKLPEIWCTMDVVADYSHIENVYHEVTQAMENAVDPKWKLSLVTHFSHWYDWGSMIYPRFKIPVGPTDHREARELHDKIVHDATMAALKAGAVINDHHGVGMRLAPYMQDQFGGAGMSALRAIKHALDPNNIMCPGKLALEAE
jgi:alkyldihydroxyacetonephosphate synthase